MRAARMRSAGLSTRHALTRLGRPPSRLRAEAKRQNTGVELLFFFFQAEDGIRDLTVTGVQTCALPIWITLAHLSVSSAINFAKSIGDPIKTVAPKSANRALILRSVRPPLISLLSLSTKIGRAHV